MSSYTTLRSYNNFVDNTTVCSNRFQPCMSIGPALTSNEKFIAPDSDVYNESITPMMLYPGMTGFLPPPISQDLSHDLGPESIKAWNISSHHPHPPYRQHYKGCSTCSK